MSIGPAPAMSACTCCLSNNIETSIKSLAACHAIPESRADAQAGMSGSDEVDNTGLWLWPAAVGKGGPPGGCPPICTFKCLCNCKYSDTGLNGNVFYSRTLLLKDDQITQTPRGSHRPTPHLSPLRIWHRSCGHEHPPQNLKMCCFCKWQICCKCYTTVVNF